MRQRFVNAERISASHKNGMFNLDLLFEARELCRSNSFAVRGCFLKWSLILVGKLLNKTWYLGVFGWKLASTDFWISSLWVKLSPQYVFADLTWGASVAAAWTIAPSERDASWEPDPWARTSSEAASRNHVLTFPELSRSLRKYFRQAYETTHNCT